MYALLRAYLSQSEPGPSGTGPVGALVRQDEYVALLDTTGRFDSLRRKEDLLEEDVAAIFGVAQGEAELLALCFRLPRFAPAKAKDWLREHGFQPVGFGRMPEPDFAPSTAGAHGSSENPCLRGKE